MSSRAPKLEFVATADASCRGGLREVLLAPMPATARRMWCRAVLKYMSTASRLRNQPPASAMIRRQCPSSHSHCASDLRPLWVPSEEAGFGRFNIARAIAKRPDVLLCDEPTGALDSRTGITVLEAIERINRDIGTLAVIITHNAILADMADRVFTLSDGRIVNLRTNQQRGSVRALAW